MGTDLQDLLEPHDRAFPKPVHAFCQAFSIVIVVAAYCGLVLLLLSMIHTGAR
jgi:hypothetical protein